MQKVARRLDKLDAIFNPFREQRRITRWVGDRFRQAGELGEHEVHAEIAFERNAHGCGDARWHPRGAVR